MLWMACAALTVAVVAVLVRPLLRGGAVAQSRAAYDLRVYKDQLAEAERDVERGLMTADQAESARTEIQRRMLATTAVAERPAGHLRGKTAAVVVAVLVPAAAFAGYLALGSPGLPDQPFAERPAKRMHLPPEQAQQILAKVGQLAERLKQSPDDPTGWMMLGRSYRILGEMDKAKAAYTRAAALKPDDVAVRLELVDVLLQTASGDTLPPEIGRVMREVLVLSPDNPDALYFVGAAEAEAGHFPAARQLWTKLATVLPQGSPERADIEKQLQDLPK